MGFSVVHWLILLVVLSIWVIPAVKIVQKAGYSGWWVALAIVPLINIVMLWVFAFADWPSLARRTEPPPIRGA
jgi:hypothetical protein